MTMGRDDATIRDLQGRTPYPPLLPEYEAPPSADPPLPESPRPIFGAAIVTANSGGGAYTITEARRTGAALAALEAPDGFVDRDAHAIGDYDGYEVDDEVLYWQVPTSTGSYATYIERGQGPGEVTLDTSLSYCFILNYRITANGNIVATQVETGGVPAKKWIDNEGNDL